MRRMKGILRLRESSTHSWSGFRFSGPTHLMLPGFILVNSGSILWKYRRGLGGCAYIPRGRSAEASFMRVHDDSESEVFVDTTHPILL
jgi:hypothetical protein